MSSAFVVRRTDQRISLGQAIPVNHRAVLAQLKDRIDRRNKQPGVVLVHAGTEIIEAKLDLVGKIVGVVNLGFQNRLIDSYMRTPGFDFIIGQILVGEPARALDIHILQLHLSTERDAQAALGGVQQVVRCHQNRRRQINKMVWESLFLSVAGTRHQQASTNQNDDQLGELHQSLLLRFRFYVPERE